MLSPRTLLFAAGFVVALSSAAAAPRTSWKLDFGGGPLAPGFLAVNAGDFYTAERGYGFEPGASISTASHASADPLRADAVVATAPFFFSIDVPEGNYRVRIVAGDGQAAAKLTIKAELRRLMIEDLAVPAGQHASATFIVNTRTPVIPAVDGIAAGQVSLKGQREIVMEAWAWDEKLTLEFNSARPAIAALEIERVEVPTVFVLGDSTSCDQPREPFASWGQMLTRFFQPTVAVANHGESGESYSASLSRRRIDKIASALKPGDVVILQFGHNDQKERGENAGPFLNYKENIRRHVAMIRGRGGLPVIVSPVERRAFDAAGKVRPSLTDYAEAARQSAKELATSFIDLNATSVPFYEFLESHGAEYSRRAFAGQDNTHHNNYGAYQLAKAIAQGLKDAKLDIARHLAPDFRGFDPRRPDPVESFAVPASPGVQGPRPLGN